jgi:hypothetical protein
LQAALDPKTKMTNDGVSINTLWNIAKKMSFTHPAAALASPANIRPATNPSMLPPAPIDAISYRSLYFFCKKLGGSIAVSIASLKRPPTKVLPAQVPPLHSSLEAGYSWLDISSRTCSLTRRLI